MPLLYNETSDPKERSKTPELSLQAEKNVIATLSRCLFNEAKIEEGSNEHSLIQQFIYHYENLCHHHAVTVGMWCCEDPADVIDPKNVLFQIK